MAARANETQGCCSWSWIKKMISYLSTGGKSWYKHFQYKEGKDGPNDARNILLIVATLIAAVTFQAGVNPPGGVWQDNDNGHIAGRAIYGSQSGAYYVFLIANSLALSSSVLVIISLTHRIPFHLEVIVATISMIVTYCSAIFAVTPHESVRFRYVTAAAAGPFVLRGLIQLSYYLTGEHKKDEAATNGTSVVGLGNEEGRV